MEISADPAGACLRSDIAALWMVFLTPLVAGLVLTAWAALFARREG
ncbi:hypothetical protein [Maricaulis sp.]|nr:hypothetical protein [Maricaulis sp.]